MRVLITGTSQGIGKANAAANEVLTKIKKIIGMY